MFRFDLLSNVLLLCMVGTLAANEPSIYTTKFDNVNLDEILQSDRLLFNYVQCLLDKKPCTPDGLELKNNLPDAISNDCKKCSEKQKEGSERVMHYIIDNKPDWWELLEKKFNPDGTYKKEYLKKCQENENMKKGEDESNGLAEKEKTD